MKIVGNNVEKHEAQLIAGYTRQCIKLLRRKEYELNLPAGAADAAYTRLEVKNRASESTSDTGKLATVAHEVAHGI